MATIHCDVSTCQFNSRQKCTLGNIQINPGPVAASPDVLADNPVGYSGQPRAGYAAEYESYLEYAATQPGPSFSGAICSSFSPR